MNKILMILILILTTNLYSITEYEDDYIKLSWNDSRFVMEKGYHHIRQNKDEYYIHLQYSFRFNNEFSNLFVFLKMNKINDVNDLLDTLGTDKIITNPSYFGMGKIYKYAHDIGLTKLNENYERYAQDWGGDFTRDILIYTSKESNSYLKESLIQILNVWSQEFEMPFPLDNKDIDKMISNNDSRVEKYKFLDDLFSNNFVIKPFYR